MAPSTLPQRTPDEAVAWHTLEADKAIGLLESDRTNGLATQQVEARVERYGTNELVEMGGRSAFRILLDQFTNIMLLMLIAVAIISAAIDIHAGMSAGKFVFPKDAVAIFAVVFLNGVLGYIQESGAEKALAALKTMATSKVRLLRDGALSEVDSKDLVPGDVIQLEAGVKLTLRT
jgi:P-type Ca2+ transporter type 2C